jgi:hypothetical protein
MIPVRCLVLASTLLLTALTVTHTARAQQSGDSTTTTDADQPAAALPPVDTHQTPDFAAFWQRFIAAAKKNDRKSLQAMTQLPFLYDGAPRDAAHFGVVYKAIFDTKSRACLAGETPIVDQDNYEVFCGEMIYVFGPATGLGAAAAKAADGSGWRLLEIGAND